MGPQGSFSQVRHKYAGQLQPNQEVKQQMGVYCAFEQETETNECMVAEQLRVEERVSIGKAGYIKERMNE